MVWCHCDFSGWDRVDVCLIGATRHDGNLSRRHSRTKGKVMHWVGNRGVGSFNQCTLFRMMAVMRVITCFFCNGVSIVFENPENVMGESTFVVTYIAIIQWSCP